jgi:dTDP-4-amino-4,6-dideoxygalactose transaminase
MKTDQCLLALHGGNPVRKRPMPARVALGPDEQKMVSEALAYYIDRETDPCYQGYFESRYTEAFSASLGGGFADAVATGTLAIYVALAALGLPEGSEVLVSPVTDPGTLSAIVLNRLVPRLIDSAPHSYNIDCASFSARIGPAVRAAVIVHSIGRAAPIDDIAALARTHGIKVLEDCSQSHGATLAGLPVGTFGDIAAFSTMYRKAHITGACGGVVYSRDRGLHRIALAHADRGKPRWIDNFDDVDPSTFLFPALNHHANEIACAIGCASLRRLPETIRLRRIWVAAFYDALTSESGVCAAYPHCDADSPFVVPVVVDPDRIDCSVARFAEAVRAEGVDLNPCYKYVVDEWPWLNRYLADGFRTNNARDIRDRTFMLKINEKYGDQELTDVIESISKVEKYFRR